MDSRQVTKAFKVYLSESQERESLSVNANTGSDFQFLLRRVR
jgi:phosphoribosylformylglycinamidine (FGAM) synthase-like enzyme